MKLPNSFRKALHSVWHRIFDAWWDFYYTYYQSPPKRYYKKMFKLEPDVYEWELINYGKFPDPICFKLPLGINCVACYGCKLSHDPFLSPDRQKEPFKVFFSDEFCSQYEMMFGKSALVELLYKMEKHNESIEEGS